MSRWKEVSQRQEWDWPHAAPGTGEGRGAILFGGVGRTKVFVNLLLNPMDRVALKPFEL